MYKYRSEIDGLRTLAVIPVILFHLGYTWINGGYYGVDVFFVISGFLITGILKEKIQTNTFSMWSFWIRRIKRLLPVLLTVIITTIIFSYIFLYKPILLGITEGSIPAIFSYFNFYARMDLGNYWGGSAEDYFFLHTWSLSVEEQFYLFYPLFLFLSFKLFKGLKAPIIFITISSFILFVIGIHYKPIFTFYMLPTRLWELSIGGFISLLGRKTAFENKKLSNYASVIGVVLIGTSYLIDTGNLSLMVILPLIGTSLILYYCQPSGWVGKLLSLKPMVFIGKISYSLYLWHWPVTLFFKNNYYLSNNLPFNLSNLYIGIITTVLSVLSYYFVENKTRNYKYTPAIVIAGIIVVVTFSFGFRSDLKYIRYKQEFTNDDFYIFKYDISATPVHLVNVPLIMGKNIPFREEKFQNAYKEEGLIYRIDNKSPEIVMIGDSHALMWTKMIIDISEDLKVSNSVFGAAGVHNVINVKEKSPNFVSARFTNAQFEELRDTFIQKMQNWKPKILIVSFRWDLLNDEEFKKFQYLIDFCKEINTKVLFIAQPPMLTKSGFNNFNANEYFSFLGYTGDKEFNYFPIVENETIKQREINIVELCKKNSNTSFYNTAKKMLSNDKILISNKRNSFYFDDDHLSYEGTLFHYDEIKEIISKSFFTTTDIQ